MNALAAAFCLACAIGCGYLENYGGAGVCSAMAVINIMVEFYYGVMA